VSSRAHGADRRCGRPRSALSGLFLASAALAGLLACSDAAYPRFALVAEPDPPADRPLEVPWEGYASSDACQSCHPSEYESWHASFHRTMTQVVTPQTVLATWEGEVVVEGKTYRFERPGDELWVEYDDPDARGPTPPERLLRRVVLSTGTHHFQAYWVPEGADRMLTVLPICWRVDEERWMPTGSAFLVPERAERSVVKASWNKSCLRCHATKFRPRIVNETGADTHVVEFGIACEACHGPAAEHVELNRDPLRRYGLHLAGAGDPTVVEPTALTAERASQVCGQCHGLTRLEHQREIRRWNQDGVAFEAGDDLLAQRELETEGASYFWPDGMVRVSGREYNGLLRSPCYVHGDAERKLACMSCHEMHPAAGDPRPLEEWRDDQLKPGMRGDLACTQCHVQYADPSRAAEHAHHPLGSSGAACTSCHTPYTTWGLLKAIQSHEISSPDVATELATGRPNACNLCHLDRTLAWTADSLARWYGTPEPALDADQSTIAAGVRWALSGDAGLRALAAWHMGFSGTHEAAGTDWMPPYLGQLLEDPYDAVRFRAWRSLRELAGFADLGYEPSLPVEARAEAHVRVLELWRARASGGADPRLLLSGRGELEAAAFERLLGARDDRPVILAE
jgi:hypothetical protein